MMTIGKPVATAEDGGVERPELQPVDAKNGTPEGAELLKECPERHRRLAKVAERKLD
jgi:hypothetical protein